MKTAEWPDPQMLAPTEPDLTSVLDAYLAALRRGERPSKEELFRPGLNDYALGFFVRKDRGRTVQSHSGSVRGFISDVRRYPDQRACLFVLANDDGAPLHLGNAGRHADDDASAPPRRTLRLADEAGQHPLRGLEVGNHAITHRPNRGNRCRCPSQHRASIVTNGFRL